MARRAKKVSPSRETLLGRIAWLLHTIWQGKQTLMASALGVHSASISNIMRGVRPPGREFLGLLAAHPLVNDRWLLEGLGEPLRSTSRLLGGDAALAVVDKPLPGPPSDWPNLLGTTYGPVYQYLYRPSRYWLTVSSDCPWARSPGLRIAAGDRVLIETDPNHWPSSLLRRLCIARIKGAQTDLFYAVNQSASSQHTKSSDLELFGCLKECAPKSAMEEEYGKEQGAVQLDAVAETTGSPNEPMTIVGIAVHRCGDC